MLSANRTTGEMENYEPIPSSRIKFPYPREEEVGHPTLTAAQLRAEPEKARPARWARRSQALQGLAAPPNAPSCSLAPRSSSWKKTRSATRCRRSRQSRLTLAFCRGP